MDARGLATYIDIALVALALFAVITWLKRARAGLAVAGALLLAVVYLAAREFRLELTAWAFQSVFTVFVIVLVVVLQNDLRRLFERVAALGVGGGSRAQHGPDDPETLCETVFELAGRRCGALIVLPGRDPVERYVEGGESLDGKLSRPLLLSLFDPGSVGHDGAVVIDGPVVRQFAAHLPLSANFTEIQTRGTRHSAALGLSEVTDALCIAVSEERGEVSIAHEGRLTLADSVESLRKAVQRFLEEQASAGSAPRRAVRALRKGWLDAALSILLSLGLWQLFISGTEIGRKTLTVPVLVDSIDPGFELVGVEPPEVQVELSGLRRDLYLLDPASVEVRLDATLVALGRRTFRLSTDSVRRPPDLRVRTVSPDSVVLRVAPAGEGSPPQSAENPP